MIVSRRGALRAIGAASLARVVARALPASVNGIPVTGRTLPGMEALDSVATSIMHAHAIPGASLDFTRQAPVPDGDLLTAFA